MARWLYRQKPLTHAEINAIIVSADGFKAGLVLLQDSLSPWTWLEVTSSNATIIRECTDEEKQKLNDLLKGEICIRILECKKGVKFAVASIE